MAVTTLKPSDVRSNADRYSPEHPVTIRCPLREVCGSMQFPLQLLGFTGDDVRTGLITEADRFNAQGLEGAAEIDTTWCKAYVLLAKTEDSRAIVRIRED